MLSVLLVAPGRSTGTESSASEAEPRFYSVGYVAVSTALVAVYALVSYLQPHSLAEVPLGLFALLFAPGYALAAPLLARQPGLPWTLNLPIAAGLSVILNVLVGIVLLLVGPGLSIRYTAVADL